MSRDPQASHHPSRKHQTQKPLINSSPQPSVTHPLHARHWLFDYPLLIVVVFLGLTATLIWGNLRLQKGSVIDDAPILNADDAIQQMHQYVLAQQSRGFEAGDAISFILQDKLHSPEALTRVLQFTEKLEAAFGDSLLSLSKVPAYQDTGEALRDEPYITHEELTSPLFNLSQWQEKVARDGSVYGPLLGRDFSWTAVVRYLPPKADDILEFRRTAEFLENRTIPWWEWLFKRDITPADDKIGVGGWVIGRGLIDQGINVDMLSLTNLGVILALPVFWAVFGSLSATLLAANVVLLTGFLWTRGAMGFLPDMQERVYSLLVYASVIVQGTSFALHKISAFQNSTAHNARQAWHDARHVDGLIATTAFIAMFGFATLWTFDLKPMRELGLSAAVGVAVLLVLSVVVVPAIGLAFGMRPLAARSQERGRVSAALHRRLDSLIGACSRLAHWLALGKRPWAIVAGMIGMFALVAMLFHQGAISSYTKPLDFLQGTLVDRSATFLNQPGQAGFGVLGLLVEPAEGEDGRNPHFLQRAWEFHSSLAKLPQTREVSSVLATLHQISKESFKKPFPETADEVEAAFVLVESRLAPSVQHHLYFPGGVRMSVSFGNETSTYVGELLQAMLGVARRDFPDLRVSSFNRSTLYPPVDTYIREGKVENVFTSQIAIFLLCALLLYWRNRRLTQLRLSPLRGGAVMVLPLFFATVVMGLVMWWLEIPLDMSTAPIGALAISAATDFSLYFALTYQRLLESYAPLEALHHTMEEEGRVIVADCILNSLCFLPLLTSHFLPVRQVGWIMSVMLVTCAVGTLLFMAALLPSCVAAKAQSR